MTVSDPDREVRRLAAESLAVQDPTGWFERLYTAAEQGDLEVPWDRGAPHPLLAQWAGKRERDGTGRRAVVVGCGYGHDAEYLAGLGYDTVAFDISGTAVRAARQRFPESRVRYRTADLLAPPDEWREAFDLVFESMTVQALPVSERDAAIGRVTELVAPAGTLLVVAIHREDGEPPVEGPPWPLDRAEVESFARDGLRPVRIEILTGSTPKSRRWLAEFRRP
ncbi:class I SAM-dependent methyltransferase [Micromonospora sp. NPDC049559]|uniref:class I SAM-dependent methyltransferase n=1 Tax=Micromonospora sp. NPDC049559 TaxID=3155923 RepID=UPI00341E4EB6